MKTACAVLLLLILALPVQAGQVSLLDRFDGTSNVKWMVSSGDWQAREGAYHVSGSGQTYVEGLVAEEVHLEVDCRISDHGAIVADWVGVVVGGDAKTGVMGYLIYVRYSGEVELYRDGRIIAARQTKAKPKLEAGEPIHLVVDVKDRHFTVKVEDETCIEYDAADYRSGNVGLATYDVEADFGNLHLQCTTLANAIEGEVLYLPSCDPAPEAKVEIYNSMDGYNSLVTRETTADDQGRFKFTDLPSGEKAYWLRASKPGFGGITGWFVSVNDLGASKVELFLIGAPRHDLWIDSATMKATKGFRQIEDPQSFGGSRLEVKEQRPSTERPKWWATFEFDVPHEADYVPYFAAGLYPYPHYWSDYWWSIDGKGPHLASKTLAIEGSRYGDRSTLVWARGSAQHLEAGKHELQVLLRDPAPHELHGDTKAYWWSFDAAAFAEIPVLKTPINGHQVTTDHPTLTWQSSKSAERFTIQYSQEPDFSNATVTVGGVKANSFTPKASLADGAYYWRVKALPEQESPFSSSFTRSGRFVVATEAPALNNLRIVSRAPHKAVLEWRTDEPCTSRVQYGLSALAFTRSLQASEKLTTQHHVRVTGIEPMTYYYYSVEAKDRDGKASASLRRGFCTPRGVIGDRNSPFGIFGQGLTYSKQLGDAGARWYSDYWDWNTLEPSRGTFNWQQAEDRMKRAEDSKVNLTVTFWGSPPWVRPSHPTKFTHGPDDLQDARDFFQAVASHCKGRTDWWLPWIEPNVARDTIFGFPEGYWASRPHARSYAAYQRAAYEGVKAGDPDCHFVGMNTAGVDLDFIRKCYDEGAAERFDVMNVHYYAMNAPFEQQQPEKLFADLRAVMSEYGDREKPILCSEGGGASSGVEGTNEDTQADNIVRIFVLSIANNIDKLCWTFELDEKPYGSKRVDMIMWMGLFRFHPKASPDSPIGEPKPSYFAFKTMTENLYGTEYRGPLKLDAGVRAYRFEGKDRGVTVVWREKGEGDVGLPVQGRQVTVVDRKGVVKSLPARDGKVRLHINESPVFIQEEKL